MNAVSKDEQIADLSVALYRTGEVIFDMSFQLGLRWIEVPLVVRQTMMDRLNGSRGLFDWVFAEAQAFDEMWMKLPEDDPRRDAYYSEVESRFASAFDKLVLEAMNHG